MGGYHAPHTNISYLKFVGWMNSKRYFNKPQASSLTKVIKQVLYIAVDDDDSHKILGCLVPFENIPEIPTLVTYIYMMWQICSFERKPLFKIRQIQIEVPM